MKKDKVKKRHDHYLHTTQVIYPFENVKNMLSSWKTTIEQEEEWFKNYDNYLEEAKKNAELTVDNLIADNDKLIGQLMVMSPEERFKIWNDAFLEQVKESNELKNKRDKMVEEQFNKNKELLNKYKAQYEQDIKNKREAVKIWEAADK